MYHGTAMTLIPCAMPETMLAAISKRMARLFFKNVILAWQVTNSPVPTRLIFTIADRERQWQNTMEEEEKPKYDYQAALLRTMRYCAMQERCKQQLQKRFDDWRLPSEEQERIFKELKAKNFLSEERYAEAFANGKFRIKGWGKTKIKHHLKQKRIPGAFIDAALGQLEDDAYLETIVQLIARKKRELERKELSDFEEEQRVRRFLYGRGYASDDIQKGLSAWKFKHKE